MDLVCAPPIRRGAKKGQPATGTWAGYQRHRKSAEPACDACIEGYKADPALGNGYYAGNYEPRPRAQRSCVECGATFETTANPRRQTCSRLCWERQRRARYGECRWCGKTYRLRGRGARTTACSRACTKAYGQWKGRKTPWADPWADRDGTVAQIVARYASRTFSRCGWCRAVVAGNRLWCSEQHLRWGNGYGIKSSVYIYSCDGCGDLFTSRWDATKYCSKTCRASRVPDSARRSVHERDGGVCQICGDPTDANDFTTTVGSDGREAFVAGPLYPTVDHIVPRALGGDDSVENLRTAHHYCNTVRGTAEGEQLAWAV